MRYDHVHMKGVTLDVMEESHVEGGMRKEKICRCLRKSMRKTILTKNPLILRRRMKSSSLSKRGLITFHMDQQIKIPYSSIDWVDRNNFGVKNVGGEEFNFCYNFFLGLTLY